MALRAVDGNGHVPDDPGNPALDLGWQIVGELRSLHAKLDTIIAKIGENSGTAQ